MRLFSKLLSRSAALIGSRVWYSIPHCYLLVFCPAVWLEGGGTAAPEGDEEAEKQEEKGRGGREEEGGGRGLGGWRQRLICVPADGVGFFLSAAYAAVREGFFFFFSGLMLFRVKGRMVRKGGMGQKVEGLALGLFAALSVPLSALAHLHLRQLDVAQHVGVWGGERKTRCVTYSIFCIIGVKLWPNLPNNVYINIYTTIFCLWGWMNRYFFLKCIIEMEKCDC